METDTPPAASPEAAPDKAKAPLSERELEILQLLATGVSNKQIAQQLVISANTVKVHLRNIFSKIGVASRMEATLYAMREGLVQMPGGVEPTKLPIVEEDDLSDPTLPVEPEVAVPTINIEQSHPQPEPITAPPPQKATQRPWVVRWAIAIISAGVLVLSLAWLTPMLLPMPTVTTLPLTPRFAGDYPHWQTRTEMPTARHHFAVAAYENQLYVIGGETVNGPTAVSERFSPTENRWETLAAKLTAVTDINAGVIGGRVYVPGGRLANGQVTDVLESYDIRRNLWEQRASLPKPLSAYALVTFEGKLYVFGGWDGQAYVATTYEYSPDTNRWSEKAALPTPRGHLGATVANDRIYIFGGKNTTEALSTTMQYLPELDDGTNLPWQAFAPLPAGLVSAQAVSIADAIYLLGQSTDGTVSIQRYSTNANRWENMLLNPAQPQAALGALGTTLHLLGGANSTGARANHWVYQSGVSIFLPAIQNNP